MQTPRILRVSLFLAALLLLGGGLGAQASKVIYIGQVNPPVTFNPLSAGDIASQYDQQPIFDSLLDMVEPLKFLPKLADSFTLKDPTTLVIKLNPKAAWTDGTPVSADDVAFTINLVANPKTEVSIGTYIAPFAGLSATGKLPEGQTSLSSLTIVDPKTLEIKLAKPVDPNLIKEQFGVKLLILPKHVLKDVDPAKLAQDPYFQNPTVTSGPFKFVRYAKDQYVEYTANPAYYRGAPKIQKLFIKIIPATNLAAQLQSGEIHFNSGVGIGLFPSADFETVKGLPGIAWKSEKKTGIQFVIFNVKTVADPAVRQAIAYAIDRPTIISKLLKGNAESVDGPYTSTGSVNFSGYASAETDSLLEKGRNEVSFEKRKAIYDKLQELWSRDLPQLTLYSDRELLAYSKKLIVAEPRFFGTFYNVNQWDITK